MIIKSRKKEFEMNLGDFIIDKGSYFFYSRKSLTWGKNEGVPISKAEFKRIQELCNFDIKIDKKNKNITFYFFLNEKVI
jgi:hypothetical protein